MIIIISTRSTRERLTIVSEEEPQKPVLVRGHFRMVNGKRVYVKAYLRKA